MATPFDEMHRRQRDIAARRRGSKKKKISLLLSNIAVTVPSAAHQKNKHGASRSSAMKCAVFALGEPWIPRRTIRDDIGLCRGRTPSSAHSSRSHVFPSLLKSRIQIQRSSRRRRYSSLPGARSLPSRRSSSKLAFATGTGGPASTSLLRRTGTSFSRDRRARGVPSITLATSTP